MTRDEALRKAQVALGCHVERDDSEREWCNHPYHSNCPPLWWHVTDVILDVDREARAAALDGAADECEIEARWQVKQGAHAGMVDRFLVLAHILRDRARAIREGR